MNETTTTGTPFPAQHWCPSGYCPWCSPPRCPGCGRPYVASPYPPNWSPNWYWISNDPIPCNGGTC